MKVNFENSIKLILPISLFPILAIPYQFLNSNVLVEWLGCGCPKVDVSGEMIHDYFSANDFTEIFWTVIAIGVTILATFLSKGICKEKKLARIFYVLSMLIVSLFVAYMMIQAMMWN